MQRDVKVGLVLGVLLVAVVAVVFFRRDDDDRDKFKKLLPAPDAVANRARDMLGSAPSDPYPVSQEYLPDTWQAPKSKAARTPTPARNRDAEGRAQTDSADRDAVASSSGGPAAILERPEFDSPRPGARGKSDVAAARSRTSNSDGTLRIGNATEYTIQEGDTLSEIARRTMGSASHCNELYEFNKDILSDPGSIHAGQKIRIPNKTDRTAPADRLATQPATQAGGPASTLGTSRTPRTTARNDGARGASDGNNYVVKEGDSLFSIARERYGRDAMYLEIYRANEDQLANPGAIRPGMVLKLP
jgi:nucleoid-associated protein YgaU